MTGDRRALYGAGRLSAQRSVIAEALGGLPGAFTAEDLHHAVRKRSPRIALATVYRALAAMQNAGAVAAVGERDGSTLLVLCDRDDHHHHLVCTSCSGVVGIECPLDGAALNAAARAGHVITSHQITLYGLCAACARESGR